MNIVVHIDSDAAWRDVVGAVCASLEMRKPIGFSHTREGIIACRKIRPDMVIFEAEPADCDGNALVDELQRFSSSVRLVALTSRCDDVLLHKVATSISTSLIWKTPDAKTRLSEGIRKLASDPKHLPLEVKKRLLEIQAAPDYFPKILSPIEQALIPMFGRGHSNEVAAEAMGLAVNTVKWHRQLIFQKLNFKRTFQLVEWALQKGFVVPLRPAPNCVFAETQLPR